jgi:hypothetical protein
MKRKIVFSIVLFVLVLGQIQAQPGSFAIKITQVYPVGGVVYRNNYNLSGELDKAEQKLRNQYSGKNANYIMELTRPSGKETKYIQNIYWVLVENETRKNLKSKPELQEHYPQSTAVKYYACDINGKQKSDFKEIKYDYYSRFYRENNTVDAPVTEYRTPDGCLKKAKEDFTANKIDTLLCKAVIYDSKGNVADSTINNREAYTQYLVKKKHIADSIAEIKKQEELKQEKLKQEKLKTDSIENVSAKPVYNKQETKERLKQLQIKANSLQKKQTDLQSNMQTIIDEADKIIAILGIDSLSFDRNKYFGTAADLNDLKSGIKKLLEINKKKIKSSPNQKPPKNESDKPKAKGHSSNAVQSNKNEIPFSVRAENVSQECKVLSARAETVMQGCKPLSEYSETVSQECKLLSEYSETISQECKLFSEHPEVNMQPEKLHLGVGGLKKSIEEPIKISNKRT